MRRLTLLASALLLGGCESILSTNAAAPPSRAEQIIQIEPPQDLDFDVLLADMSRGKPQRNAEVMKLVGLSELSCGQFISQLYTRRAVTNVWYTGLTTATSAAAAIVGGRAAQNLAGVSAVTNQARSSINAEIYGGELISSLSSEITKIRKVQLDSILRGVTQELKDYPPEMAISDVVRYHELCSIPIAMSSILRRANSGSSGAPDLSSALSNLDSAIGKEQKLIVDMGGDLSAADKAKIQQRILGLSEQRSLLVRLYSTPQPQLEPEAQP